MSAGGLPIHASTRHVFEQRRLVRAIHRSTRGYTSIFVICDEVAFWPSDGPHSDAEILRALGPTLATTGGPLICLSTPHARVGALYDAHQKYFGRDGDVLVWVAASAAMNPTLDARIIDRAYADDPESASAEYGAQFRSDLRSLFDPGVLDTCVTPGRPLELPPQAGIAYVAHVDTSGGREESFGLCIAHKETNNCVVVDLVREWTSPFKPPEVVADVAGLLKRYNCASVTGDKYGAQWVVSAFEQHAISYQANELNKSQLFIETLAIVNSRQCELPDHKRLLGQFAGLQRRVGSSGRDFVHHRDGQRDDLANAVAGALWAALHSSGLPMLPADFSVCNRALSGLPSTGSACYLFGGDFRPPNDVICRNCVGKKFVQEARRAHQQRTGEWIDVVHFYRHHITPNPAIAGRLLQAAARRLADVLGL